MRFGLDYFLGSFQKMYAAIQNSQWDECAVRYSHGPSPVTYVFRRGAPTHAWEPWVVVGESALLRRLGRSGLGLYAARALHRDDLVGRYDGTVVGTFASRRAALESSQAQRLVRRGHDKLITRKRRHGPGIELVDGDTSGPPYMMRLNDPRGTRLQANVGLTEGGYVKVTQRRVPAFDLGKPLEANASSELRLEYGDEYWAMMDALGSDAAHALEVD